MRPAWQEAMLTLLRSNGSSGGGGGGGGGNVMRNKVPARCSVVPCQLLCCEIYLLPPTGRPPDHHRHHAPSHHHQPVRGWRSPPLCGKRHMAREYVFGKVFLLEASH